MKTVFLRVLDAPPHEKGLALRAEISERSSAGELNPVDLSILKVIPGTPFAYWVTRGLASLFATSRTLKSEGYSINQGLITADDFRFIRLRWELEGRAGWSPFAKGSSKEGFLSEFSTSVRTDSDFRELIVSANNKYPYLKGGAAKMLHAMPALFGRPGLAYTRRTTSRFRTVALDEGICFSDKLPLIAHHAVQPNKADLLFLLGVTSSQVFAYMVELSMGAADTAARSYETGIIERIPLPDKPDGETAESIQESARALWHCRLAGLMVSETSRHFLRPAILGIKGKSLRERCSVALARDGEVRLRATALTEQLEHQVADAYRLSGDDRAVAISVSSAGTADLTDENSDDDDESDALELDHEPMLASLTSWSFGVAFGRFDVRIVTNERSAPPEPEPFDQLPACAPGMLTGVDGLPLTVPPENYPLSLPTEGFLVDDPGHPRDLVNAVRAVFETVFDDANARWHEAAELLSVPDLRTWYATQFFELHIKRYSKSRRKAPIYWQLATASGSYSVWIYIHRATSDTLFKLLEADVLGGKLDYEKSKLDSLAQDAGANPSAAARREIELQENFVSDLNALKTEIARVAPLWKPNLDDGVILNFAPLWRLVPQSRSWQAECKKAWDKLASGGYDWAHLAMHLWPERVVLKCIDDRSLAIAHGLEEVFWHEDASGTWQKQQVDEATVQKLIDERTSATVKTALRDLLSAATPAVSKGRKPKAKSPSPQSAAPKSVPAIARAPAAEAIVDEATLTAVKAAIARVAGGASKADVLTTTGLSDTDWNKAVAVLLDRGVVIRSGQKRGTRYHVGPHGENR